MKPFGVALAYMAFLTGTLSAQDDLSDLVNPFLPFPSTANRRGTDDRPGPWDSDVLIYRASATGSAQLTATFSRAGVPTVARLKDGRLMAAHQHFPSNDAANFDKVAVHFSKDEGNTWSTPEVISLTGLPAGMRFPFDPTLVPLPDGRVRLYFTSHAGETMTAIYSAVSDDGLHFTYESGARFAVEGQMVVDCAVALHDGMFHLFAPVPRLSRNGGGEPQRQEGRGYHAVSRDGLAFQRMEDVRMEGRRDWLGNVQSVDGKLVFIGTGEPGASKPASGVRRAGIWMAESTDGNSWKLLTQCPAVPGADPGGVKTRDGAWILAVTGEPREGTASARRMGIRY